MAALDARPEPRLVVAIGASAGGLEPLQSFVEVAPVGAGIAYVVLQHLSPDHPTLMQSLLSHHSQMPVVTAEHGMVVQPDVVYLLPARAVMTVAGGRLQLEEQVRTTGDPLRTIDRFMESLAADRGSSSVAVVLSGTGSDAAAGAAAIRAAGGFTIAQDASASFGGMPDAAIRTGAVDRVLDPRSMPDAILAFAVDPDLARIDDEPVDDAEAPFARVIERLEEAFGIDFGAYKPNTVHRRVRRRFELTEQGNESEYLDRLVSDPEELSRLYRDLLIGVTEFFRDGAPWVVLGEVAADLVARAAEDSRDVRAWIAGCATGEEAYSVAMTLHEAAERAGFRGRIRVFATDADPHSIEIAAAGVYDEESMRGVSGERRARFFVTDGDDYRVTNELRQSVTFTRHDLLSEPPFTRLDLVTCRNLLIYLRPEARARVLALMHFSLRVGGALFLGGSESAEPYGGEFTERDGRSRIFTKARDVRLIGSQPLTRHEVRTPATAAPRTVANEWLMRAYDDILERHGPSGFLVDENRRLLHILGRASPLLHIPSGRVTGDLLDQLDESLRFPLWGALQRAFTTRQSVELDDLVVRTIDGTLPVRLVVTPLAERRGGPAVALVVVDGEQSTAPDLDGATRLERAAGAQIAPGETADVVLLERELQLTRETLQSTVEELEASNEELVASNEELQSTNEELQSVNEELHTVNGEYAQKITELTQLTNDLDNLMASTEIGTLFLDRELGVRRYTPDVGRLFRLRPSDVGRSIEDFADHLGVDGLYDRLRAVVDVGAADEQRVWLDEHNVLVRLHPYLVDDVIDGVVMTLVNFDVLIETQEQLAAEAGRFNAFMSNSPALKWALDEAGQFAFVNEAYCETMGVTPDECLGRTPAEALAGKTSASFLEQHRASNERTFPDGRTSFDVEVELEEGRRWLQAVRFPFDYLGQRFVGGSAIDVTESREAVEEARRSAHRLQELLDSFPEPIWALDAEGLIERVNAAARKLSDSEPIGLHPVEVYGPGVDWLSSPGADPGEWPFGTSGPRHLRTVSSTTFDGGRLVIGVDISELVEAQLLLQRRASTMAERNVELDQFAHVASHDLRAPIRAMHLLAQQALAGEEDLETFAREVAGTAERMREVIDSLLAYANIGRHEVAAAPIDLGLVIDSVRLDLRAELEAHHGRIEHGELPTWSFDPVLLRRALMNLALNALVHGGVDEPVVRIEAREVETGELEIDVIDNGRGIGDHEGIDIFDPFTRVSSSRAGSGMGLAIARRVAQRHRGSIDVVRSGPDGTTIRLRLGSTDAAG